MPVGRRDRETARRGLQVRSPPIAASRRSRSGAGRWSSDPQVCDGEPETRRVSCCSELRNRGDRPERPPFRSPRTALEEPDRTEGAGRRLESSQRILGPDSPVSPSLGDESMACGPSTPPSPSPRHPRAGLARFEGWDAEGWDEGNRSSTSAPSGEPPQASHRAHDELIDGWRRQPDVPSPRDNGRPSSASVRRLVNVTSDDKAASRSHELDHGGGSPLSRIPSTTVAGPPNSGSPSAARCLRRSNDDAA